MRWVPPEVRLDDDGRQVLAPGFNRYEPCAGGCGYLIGCGDAIDTICHESCEEREKAQQRAAVDLTAADLGRKISLVHEGVMVTGTLRHVDLKLSYDEQKIDVALGLKSNGWTWYKFVENDTPVTFHGGPKSQLKHGPSGLCPDTLSTDSVTP